MKMLRFGVALLVCTLGERVNGQSIFTNPITGSTLSSDNPYTTGQTVDPKIVVTGIGRGGGVTGVTGSNRYSATGWNVATLTSAVSGNRHFTWTIAPVANHVLNYGNVSIATYASGNAPITWSLQSSLGGFGQSGSLATGTPGTSVAVADGTLGSQFDSVTSSVEFRLFAYGASDAAGVFGVNDFTYNGIVSVRSATVLTWDGGRGNGLWNAYAGIASDQSNWNLNNIPTVSLVDSLKFTGGTQVVTTNNITGLIIDSVVFDHLASSFVLDGNTITLNSGVTNSSGGTQTINLPVILGGSQTWDTGTGSIVANGTVSGPGSITKIGAGTLVLGGVNSYSGNTHLNEGVLSVSDTSNLGSATNSVIFNGGTLQFSAGRTFDLSTRTVTINADGATINTDAGNVTFANGIGNSGAGGLTKVATGTLTLNGANTYSGTTTVAGGTLALGANGSINQSSGITVGLNNTYDVSAVSGGYTLGTARAQTLQGSGTVAGGVTVASGSTIRGGDSTTPGTLTLGNGLTLNSGAIVGIHVDAAGNSAASGTGGSSSGGNNSVLSLTGGATISSGTRFTIDGTGVSFALNQPYSYKIMTGAGDQSSLNVTNQSLFETIGFSAESFSVTGTLGGDVFVNFTPVPVPEPGAVLAIAAAALGVGGFVRRRFRKGSEPTNAA